MLKITLRKIDVMSYPSAYVFKTSESYDIESNNYIDISENQLVEIKNKSKDLEEILKSCYKAQLSNQTTKGQKSGPVKMWVTGEEYKAIIEARRNALVKEGE